MCHITYCHHSCELLRKELCTACININIVRAWTFEIVQPYILSGILWTTISFLNLLFCILNYVDGTVWSKVAIDTFENFYFCNDCVIWYKLLEEAAAVASLDPMRLYRDYWRRQLVAQPWRPWPYLTHFASSDYIVLKCSLFLSFHFRFKITLIRFKKKIDVT